MSVNVLNYFGSKILLAPKYPCHSGRVVEPFAGGAGYSLATEARIVRLHDLDVNVCAAWTFFLSASACDILRLPLIEPGQDVLALDCEPAARTLIGYWLNRSAAPCRTLSPWGVSALGTSSEACFWSARRRFLLAEQRARMRASGCDWTIERSSYERSWRGADWFYFVDPPYQVQGKHYKHGSDALDFGALGEWCRWVADQGAPIVVCENEGATWLPFERVARIYGSKIVSGHKKTSVEVAWTQNCRAISAQVALL